MIIAAIDVGTNTALLLVARVDGDGTLQPLYEERRFVRLGEGVDATRQVNPASMERLRVALLDYREIAQHYQAAAITIGGTSASRDARNQKELIAFVRRETGLQYEIISGLEEAVWSFRGALSALDDVQGLCAVIDIGGGSTEIVLGEPEGQVQARHSLDVGSVRLTERFFVGQPPTQAAIEEAEAFIIHLLTEAAIPLEASVPFISAAETPLLVALVNQGVSSWDELDTAVLTAETVHAWRTRLLAMTYDDVVALNPILIGRADVFPAAVLLLDTILRQYRLTSCRVSPRSLRHGLALRYVDSLHQ